MPCYQLANLIYLRPILFKGLTVIPSAMTLLDMSIDLAWKLFNFFLLTNIPIEIDQSFSCFRFLLISQISLNSYTWIYLLCCRVGGDVATEYSHFLCLDLVLKTTRPMLSLRSQFWWLSELQLWLSHGNLLLLFLKQFFLLEGSLILFLCLATVYIILDVQRFDRCLLPNCNKWCYVSIDVASFFVRSIMTLLRMFVLGDRIIHEGERIWRMLRLQQLLLQSLSVMLIAAEFDKFWDEIDATIFLINSNDVFRLLPCICLVICAGWCFYFCRRHRNCLDHDNFLTCCINYDLLLAFVLICVFWHHWT